MKYIFVAIFLTVVNITAVFAADPPAAQGQGQVDRGVCKTDNSARAREACKGNQDCLDKLKKNPAPGAQR